MQPFLQDLRAGADSGGAGPPFCFHFGDLWCTFRHLGSSLGLPVATFCLRKMIQNFNENRGPGGVSKTGVGGIGLDLWGCGNSSHSENIGAKHMGKAYSGNIALTGAVRKGGLLRG